MQIIQITKKCANELWIAKQTKTYFELFYFMEELFRTQI